MKYMTDKLIIKLTELLCKNAYFKTLGKSISSNRHINEISIEDLITHETVNLQSETCSLLFVDNNKYVFPEGFYEEKSLQNLTKNNISKSPLSRYSIFAYVTIKGKIYFYRNKKNKIHEYFNNYPFNPQWTSFI